jgi:biopolymer transport protein ExbD
MVDYPNVAFHGDAVLVTWIRAIIKPRPGQFTGGRLLVAPVSWFYEDEPAYEPPVPTPTLEVNGVAVQSVYIDDRFLVELTDVAKALGRRASANMFAPIHQTLTYLDEEPTYDDSGMADKEKPVLRVTVVAREKAPLVIRIDENERLFMNERQTALESLRSRLGQEMSRTGQTMVTIESAEVIPQRFIMRVAELVKGAGAREIRLRSAAGGA